MSWDNFSEARALDLEARALELGVWSEKLRIAEARVREQAADALVEEHIRLSNEKLRSDIRAAGEAGWRSPWDIAGGSCNRRGELLGWGFYRDRYVAATDPQEQEDALENMLAAVTFDCPAPAAADVKRVRDHGLVSLVVVVAVMVAVAVIVGAASLLWV